MILVDFSQVILSSILVNLGKELENPGQDVGGMIRHLFFNSLLSYKKQFKDCGDIVLCMDSRTGYWRKDYFPFYKGDRKRGREKSKIDFEYVFKILDEFRAELKDTFRFKIIMVDKAEADDIIAVMCKYTQDNELITEGLFDSTPQKTVIISSDQDFFQLHKYKNIQQYSPMKKKLVKPEVSIEKFMIEHIVKAGDDAIPNILSADNCIAEQIRQNSVTKAVLERFLTMGESGCENDTQRRNWKRNETLINFDYIPTEISYRILNEYITYEPRGSKMKMMSYMTKWRFKQLFERLGEF